MLGVVKEQAGPENAGKWAVTDAFPDGGGNWGGSYLAVPKQSKHPKEAAELAAWLTAPEQQIKAFQKTGNFPSQVEALTSPELLEHDQRLLRRRQDRRAVRRDGGEGRRAPVQGSG